MSPNLGPNHFTSLDLRRETQISTVQQRGDLVAVPPAETCWDVEAEPSHHQDHGMPVTEAPLASTTSPYHPMPLGDGILPATSTMSPGTMSRARIRCTPLRSARITFPISGSYSFKASMALSAFLSCKQRRSKAAGGGVAGAGKLLPHPLRRQEHPNPSPGFGVHFAPWMGQVPRPLQQL